MAGELSGYSPENDAIVGSDQPLSVWWDSRMKPQLVALRQKYMVLPSGLNTGVQSLAGPETVPGAKSSTAGAAGASAAALPKAAQAAAKRIDRVMPGPVMVSLLRLLCCGGGTAAAGPSSAAPRGRIKTLAGLRGRGMQDVKNQK